MTAVETSRENSFLTSPNHYFHVQQYIMLTRDVRHSQSAISFSFTKKQSENTTSNDQLNDQEKIQKKQRQH